MERGAFGERALPYQRVRNTKKDDVRINLAQLDKSPNTSPTGR